MIAALTGSSVYRYAERFRVTGNVLLSVKKNGPAQLLYEFEGLLIQAHPGIYVRELQYHTNLQNSASVRNNTTAHKAAEFYEDRCDQRKMRFESMAMPSEDNPPRPLNGCY